MDSLKTRTFNIFLLLFFIVADGYACPTISGDIFWSKDELIEKSKSILLVKTVESKSKNYFNFEILEVLKGDSPSDINNKHISHYEIANNEKYDSRDFDGHIDGEFWVESYRQFGNGRTNTAHCKGQLHDHTFITGEQYLLFPDSLGAQASAEIIRTKNDQWYKYVKTTVSSLVEINGTITINGDESGKITNLFINFIPDTIANREELNEWLHFEGLAGYALNHGRHGHNISNNQIGNKYKFSFIKLPMKHFVSIFSYSDCNECDLKEKRKRMYICLLSGESIELDQKELEVIIKLEPELNPRLFDCKI